MNEPVFPNSLTELMERITPERVAELVKRVTFTCVMTPGTVGVVAHAYLDGMFYVGSGVCVEGVEAVAKDKAMRAAEVQLWELEAYALYRASDLVRDGFQPGGAVPSTGV